MGHSRRHFTLGEFADAACSCGAKVADEEPCACLVKAAKVSGFDLRILVQERDTAVNWKHQYTGLPKFELPGTEQIEACPADSFLLPASEYPIPRGRPSTKRLKGAIDFWGKKAKRARVEHAA